MPILQCQRGTALPCLKKEPKLYCRIYPTLEPLRRKSSPTSSSSLSEDLTTDSHRRQKCPATVIEPKTVSAPLNKIVYDSMFSPTPNNFSSAVSKLKDLSGKEKNSSESSSVRPEISDILVFESRFESGNLRRAMILHQYEYDLIMQPDINTNKHTQWFYFRVSNTKTGKVYKFNIVNMIKSDSTFKFGSQLVMYSTKKALRDNIGWHRAGEDLEYFANDIKYSHRGSYYTLSFTTKFEFDDDEVYIAMSYPYTYTDLQRDLRCIELSPSRSKFCRRRSLCPTLASNNCDLVTITDFSSSSSEFYHKKVVVISARVHPGESGSSFICKGIINFLTSNSEEAALLRSKFVFKIIPMMNPDGVINGNYRCSLSGVDLNRQWLQPSRNLHPTVYHLKNILMQESEEKKLLFFCDIHCHSRKFNTFMYGCSKGDAVSNEHVFPYLFHQNCKFFNYGDCYFGVEKQKESTGRIVVWSELDLTCSYTLECSFGGCDRGPHANFHLNPDHYEEIGANFCQSLLKHSELTEISRKELKETLKNDTSFRAGSNFVDSDDESSGAKSKKKTKSVHIPPGPKQPLFPSRSGSRASKRPTRQLTTQKRTRRSKSTPRHVFSINTATISASIELGKCVVNGLFSAYRPV